MSPQEKRMGKKKAMMGKVALLWLGQKEDKKEQEKIGSIK